MRSGCSMSRLTESCRLTSSDSWQELAAVSHVLEQSLEHACATAMPHTLGIELHGTDASVPLLNGFLLASTCQPLASMVNFLSGSIRLKSVTSELISPQQIGRA